MPLTTAQACPAVATEPGIVAVRQVPDELVQHGGRTSLLDFFPRHVLRSPARRFPIRTEPADRSEGDVVVDRTLDDERRALCDGADPPAKPALVDPVVNLLVGVEGPESRPIKAQEQRRDGRLAAPAPADDKRRLPGRDEERHVVQCGRGGWGSGRVMERDLLQRELAREAGRLDSTELADRDRALAATEHRLASHRDVGRRDGHGRADGRLDRFLERLGRRAGRGAFSSSDRIGKRVLDARGLALLGYGVVG